MTRALIVFGAGPGNGNHAAKEIVSKGIDHVILLARNTQRLQNEDAPFVAQGSSSVKIDTLRIDLADLASIPSVLDKIDSLTANDDVEVVFFNAARIKPSEPLGLDIKEFEEDFKTTNLALYIIAQHYIPKLKRLAQSNKSLKPALLVTNSHLPWDPIPLLLSLSSVKASQRTMVQSLNRAFAGSGVHIGLITAEGQVAPHNKVLNPKTIAERAVAFWQGGGEGLEVNIKDE